MGGGGSADAGVGGGDSGAHAASRARDGGGGRGRGGGVGWDKGAPTGSQIARGEREERMSLRPVADRAGSVVGAPGSRLTQVLAAGAARRAAETGAFGNNKRSRDNYDDDDDDPWYGDDDIGYQQYEPEKFYDVELSFKHKITDDSGTGTRHTIELSIRKNEVERKGNAPLVEDEEAIAEAIKKWMRDGFHIPGDYSSVSLTDDASGSVGRRNYRVVIPADQVLTNGFNEVVGPQLLQSIMHGDPPDSSFEWSLQNPKMRRRA